MALTVQNVKDSFGRLKRDITDVSTATLAEWCDYINKFIYRKLKQTDPERFMLSTTFTVTSAPQTESLPSGFRDVQPLGAGFFLRDSSGNDTEISLARTGFGRNDIGYYITKTSVVFTGMEGDSQTVVLRYIPEVTTISALADYFTVDTLVTGDETVPDEYLNYLVKAVDVFYSQWDDSVGEESFADARFVRVLNELVTTLRREPDAYAIDNYSSNF